MMRTNIRFALCCCLGLCAVLHVSAQEPKKDEAEPPIRLKRKDKPAEEAKPDIKESAKEPGKKDEPALAPGEDAKQILERVAKNMRDAEQRLKDKDASDATQQVQRDIVKDLDKLIEHSKNQSQQDQQQQQAGMGGGTGKSSRASRAQQRAQQRQNAQGQKSSPQQQPGKESGTSQSQAKMQGQTGTGVGASAVGNNAADVHKADIWGHLPEAMRLQMDAYGREAFMLKYQDMLRQYYSTIAEKGRRGEER